jgi:tRNA dimethylallyltransferase
MRAIGVAEIAGGTDCLTMMALGQQATRQYAKRQYTWFANQPPPGWSRFTEPLDAPGAMAGALALLGADS